MGGEEDTRDHPPSYTASHMMWDSFLYAMNMFYYHWLIKKLLWPITGKNIARLEEI